MKKPLKRNIWWEVQDEDSGV